MEQNNKKTHRETIGKDMASDAKFFMGYSRWIGDKGRYETWDESVERVMDMHREKYKDIMTPKIEEYISFAEEKYKQKRIVGSQRALQFGGKQILEKNTKIYNCSWSYIDRPRAFQEIMYALLCGCGVGISVQHHHIDKLPKIKGRYEKKSKVFIIPDSIEGWADAYGVLLSSYSEDGGRFPEYKGCKVLFDFSKIRPKGAMISGGFKAPGHEGLRASLQKCEELLDRTVRDTPCPIRMPNIVAYDFVMHMSDAVLSGGVRRSSVICLFSPDDEEMMNAKIGNWFETNPQRGRSNNSVILVRSETTKEQFEKIMESTKQWGDPGFVFVEDKEFGVNP